MSERKEGVVRSSFNAASQDSCSVVISRLRSFFCSSDRVASQASLLNFGLVDGTVVVIFLPVESVVVVVLGLGAPKKDVMLLGIVSE